MIDLFKEMKRREKESFESLMRRFGRAVQGSKVLPLAKKRKFHQKPLTKRKRRETAIRKRVAREIRKKRQMGLIK